MIEDIDAIFLADEEREVAGHYFGKGSYLN